MTEELKKIIAEYHAKLNDNTTDEFYGFCMPEEFFNIDDKKIYMLPNKFLNTLTDWKDDFFVYPKENITFFNKKDRFNKPENPLDTNSSSDFKKDTKYKCDYNDFLTICLYFEDEEYGECSINFNTITTRTELEKYFLTEQEYLNL